MIEYVKVWTSFLDDEWTITLSASARGVFLQFLILCRKSSEKSAFIQRSAASLGAVCGCDAGTMRKYLGKFSDDGKISVQELSTGAIRVTVLNYNYWQELRGNKEVREKVSNRRKTREKPAKITPSYPILSNPIQELSSPTGDHHAFVTFWADQYQKRTGVKYIFNGKKDGQLVKDILRKCQGIDTAKLFMVEFFNTTDEFIVDKAGFTIGVFSTQLNKIAQHLSTSRVEGESEMDRHNRLAAERYMAGFTEKEMSGVDNK